MPSPLCTPRQQEELEGTLKVPGRVRSVNEFEYCQERGAHPPYNCRCQPA